MDKQLLFSEDSAPSEAFRMRKPSLAYEISKARSSSMNDIDQPASPTVRVSIYQQVVIFLLFIGGLVSESCLI